MLKVYQDMDDRINDCDGTAYPMNTIKYNIDNFLDIISIKINCRKLKLSL